MTIKRTCRHTTVDGVRFRWDQVGAHSDHHGIVGPHMVFAVQLRDAPAGKLIVLLEFPELKPDQLRQSVGPRTVRSAVRRAWELGWDPAKDDDLILYATLLRDERHLVAYDHVFKPSPKPCPEAYNDWNREV